MSTHVVAEIPITQSASDVARNSIPVGYQEVARCNVTVDGEHAELVRYQSGKVCSATLGGEHFSTIFADDGCLKGLLRMDASLVGGVLPLRDDAKAIALDFLAKVARDLLPVVKVHWIKPHNELLTVIQRGEKKTRVLTGMKVKMQNISDGRWTWVIVGPDHKVMAFERDIVWITFPGHRKTEKWLHDSWLVEKGYSLSNDV